MDSGTNKRNLTIYYQNCRGLRTKLHSLYSNILSNMYDIIILTETWLTPDIDNNEFIDQRYITYRCDRDRVASCRQDGGGVLIAVLRELKSNIYDTSSVTNVIPSNTIEHLLIEIPSTDSSKRHIISSAYVPPRTPFSIYENHFDLLQDLLSHPSIDTFYIVGDYNMPEIDWIISSACDTTCDVTLPQLVCSGSSRMNSLINNFMNSLEAFQYNNVSNTNNRILDLFISNSPSEIKICTNALLSTDPYHPSLLAYINISQNLKSMTKRPLIKYNFYKADYELINNKINKINWNILHDLTPNSALDYFYKNIYEIINHHTPLASNRSSKFPVWFPSFLINIYKRKQKAWIRWKKHKNLFDYENFSRLRSIFKHNCDKCYKRYMESVEDNINKNVKYFWTYISQRKTKPEILSVMNYKQVKSYDPEAICNMFSDYFLSVYEPVSPTDSQGHTSSNLTDNNVLISNLILSKSEVLDQLKLLDISKGPGPDRLPPLFLIKTANSIHVPLHILYNKCLAEGVFPELWKQANITPVHKSGPKHDIENYRPISILSALSKLFERLVHNRIYPLLHNIIIEEQHGFIKNRSTTSNLLTFTNFLFHNVDQRIQIDAIYTDFTKAFDKVDHQLLLDKISFNGIRGNLLRWFASYINNRSQKVVINGYHSNSILVTSGVPQGSILGPLLFVLFVNDIKSCFQNSRFLLYADDLKAFKTITCLEDCMIFQQDLDRFTAYCSTNKLQLNISKCSYINFTKAKNILTFNYTLCNSSLIKVSSLRDLGVQLDTNLTFNTHVQNIVNKAFKLYGFVMRTSVNFKRTNTYLYLFKCLVRSQLEYAVPIWNPYYNRYKEEIENVQKKFLRTMHYRFNHFYLSYNLLLKKYSMLTLESRRTYLEVVTLYKIVNNGFDCIELVNNICYAVPRNVLRRDARSYHLFYLSSCRTNTGLRTPLRHMVENYNKSFNHIDIFLLSIGKFKFEILKQLLNLSSSSPQ